MTTDTSTGTESTPGEPGTRTRPVVTHFLTRHLWSPTDDRTLAESVAFQHRAYSRAVLIVRAFYAVSVYWVVTVINNWPGYLRAKSADPLWPTHWWFSHVSMHTGVNIIFCSYLATSLVVLLVPQIRWARILYAIALLQYMAFVNSPDKVNHDLHGWLFVSIVLIFLPKGPWTDTRRIATRQVFLVVFWIAILVVLFFYTLTGFWKIHDASIAFARGRINGFDISGFSYIVGDRLLQTNQDTLLGVFFTRYALPGWFLFTGTMYLETGSVFAAFRPRLHRVWGLALIFFHIGTDVAMGFTFPENIVLVGLLLVCSPFAPDTIAVKDTFLDLPGVHIVASALRRWRAQSAARGDSGDSDEKVDSAA